MNYIRGLVAFSGFTLAFLTFLGPVPDVSRFFIVHTAECFGVCIFVLGLLTLNFKD